MPFFTQACLNLHFKAWTVTAILDTINMCAKMAG